MKRLGAMLLTPVFGGFLTLLVAVPLLAEQNVNPGINSYYDDADVEQWRGVFERSGREVWDKRDEIVGNLRLKPGMAVADVGAGTGFFTLLMAHEVAAGGRVYAVDIEENFVKATVHRAHQQGLGNVVGVVNDQKRVNLPPESVDLVFISDTYHHFEYPRTTLRTIHQALRPGGELVIIDYKRIPGVSSAWVMDHIRAGAQAVIAEVEPEGFKLTGQPDFMKTRFFLRFQKQDAGGEDQ